MGQAPPENATPPGPSSNYTGTFENAYFGRLSIEGTGDGFTLVIGPDDISYPMTPRDKDTFTIAPFTENQPSRSISIVTFVMDGDVAESVHVEHIDDNGWGSFKRLRPK